jgi:NAD(P)-dependent dehydrogenase (short-subunit alcohol dehydrogenase family)
MKTVLITGAGRGLGKASVSCFLMRGYRVFGLVRAPEAADTMRLLGPNAVPIIGDVTDPTVGTAIDGALRCCPDGFSVIQRKVLTPNDFHSLAEVKDRLLRFQDHYGAVARPFLW